MVFEFSSARWGPKKQNITKHNEIVSNVDATCLKSKFIVCTSIDYQVYAAMYNVNQDNFMH